MKNFLALLILWLGLSAVTTLSAQRLQRYQPRKLQCISMAKINAPTSVAEGWNFQVQVNPKAPKVTKYVEMFIGSKSYGKDSSAPFEWNVSSRNPYLAPGTHRIKIKLMTKCGNSRTLYTYFNVNKLR